MFIDGKYTLYLPHKFGGREKQEAKNNYDFQS